MVTKLARWGNSLGVRIPKNIAHDAQLGDGAEVEVSLEDGRIVIAPVKRKKYSLDELLAQVTKENRHEEVDWGPPQGKEVW